MKWFQGLTMLRCPHFLYNDCKHIESCNINHGNAFRQEEIKLVRSERWMLHYAEWKVKSTTKMKKQWIQHLVQFPLMSDWQPLFGPNHIRSSTFFLLVFCFQNFFDFSTMEQNVTSTTGAFTLPRLGAACRFFGGVKSQRIHFKYQQNPLCFFFFLNLKCKETRAHFQIYRFVFQWESTFIDLDKKNRHTEMAWCEWLGVSISYTPPNQVVACVHFKNGGAPVFHSATLHANTALSETSRDVPRSKSWRRRANKIEVVVTWM